MDTHVKVLAVLYIALSALGVLAALIIMVSLGGAATIVGTTAEPADAAIAIPIIGAVGVGLVIFLLVLSLPGLLAGFGLLGFRPWARILAIVLAVLHLFNIPFGTALGIYALWVLFHRDTERLFSRPLPSPPPV